MSILGIDFGQRRCGIALSAGVLAQPYALLKNDGNFFIHLKEICIKENVERIVIGLPEGKNQREVRKFAKMVKKETKLPISFVSEVMSTQQALARLIQSQRSKKYRKKAVDAVSAAVILESYLSEFDSNKK